MDERLRRAAEAARGFMPPDEGLALHDAAKAVDVEGPYLEIGSYCGKSAIYVGAAAETNGTVLFSVDHHRGSEEGAHRGVVGGKPHAARMLPDVAKPEGLGLLDDHAEDALPFFRKTIHDADLEGTVIAVVADSPMLARYWNTPLAFLFIDGGHGTEPAHRDYELWTPLVAPGGVLAIHDVFPDPKDGGRPPYEIYCRALESGHFEEVSATGSLRVLRRSCHTA